MIQKIAESYEEVGKNKEAICETERGLKLIAALEEDPKIDRFTNYRDFFKRQIERLSKVSR